MEKNRLLDVPVVTDVGVKVYNTIKSNSKLNDEVNNYFLQNRPITDPANSVLDIIMLFTDIDFHYSIDDVRYASYRFFMSYNDKDTVNCYYKKLVKYKSISDTEKTLIKFLCRERKEYKEPYLSMRYILGQSHVTIKKLAGVTNSGRNNWDTIAAVYSRKMGIDVSSYFTFSGFSINYFPKTKNPSKEKTEMNEDKKSNPCNSESVKNSPTYEVKEYIYGKEVTSLSDSDLIDFMAELEAKISYLKNIKTASSGVTASIEAIVRDLDSIRGVLDSRHQ